MSPKDPDRKAGKRLLKKRRKVASKEKRRKLPGIIRERAVVDNLFDDGEYVRLHVEKATKNRCFGNYSELRRVEPHAKTHIYWKPGIYVKDRLLLQATGHFEPAFNKWARWFGSESRNKHFRFILRCIAVCGITRRQLRSLMRIRDIKHRGNPKLFKENCIRFSFTYSRNVREIASSVHVR